MKTIQVSDEVYEFLMNLSNEIKTQDNRGTRSPYFYQVQEDKEVGVPDGCGEKVWVRDGEVYLRTEADIKEAVFEWKEWDLNNEEHQRRYKSLNGYKIEEILRENYREVDIDITYIYSNCFLTQKGCEEYIKLNKHNLDRPTSYLFYADRNPEMEMLIKFLGDLK